VNRLSSLGSSGPIQDVKSRQKQSARKVKIENRTATQMKINYQCQMVNLNKIKQNKIEKRQKKKKNEQWTIEKKNRRLNMSVR
jgi:hypothetical protein